MAGRNRNATGNGILGVFLVSIQLYQGDCLELMKDIPDGSVDMVLADFPYETMEHTPSRTEALS